jgi:hypothetical protein
LRDRIGDKDLRRSHGSFEIRFQAKTKSPQN